MRKKKENCGTNITKDTILNSETKNKPQEKDKEKVFFTPGLKGLAGE